jgi:hypothetical protein
MLGARARARVRAQVTRAFELLHSLVSVLIPFIDPPTAGVTTAATSTTPVASTTTTTSTTTVTPTVPPHEVTVTSSGGVQIAGEDYTLTCQVTGRGPMTPTYRWFRDGSPLTGQTSATLSFSPLREIDSGVYTCEGTRNSIPVTSRTGITIRTVVGEL